MAEKVCKKCGIRPVTGKGPRAAYCDECRAAQPRVHTVETTPGGKMCARCKNRPVTSNASAAKYCDTCKANDKNRHSKRDGNSIICVIDTEGVPDPVTPEVESTDVNPFTGEKETRTFRVMNAYTAHYAREDGSSGSLKSSRPKEIFRWWIDNLTGKWNGQSQVVKIFYGDYDVAVLTREQWAASDFDPEKMMLIHKSGARNTNQLCWTEHKPGDPPCQKLCRVNPDLIRMVITEGGEGDLLAWDPESKLAIATTPKRRILVEYRPHGDRYGEHKVLDILDIGTAFNGGLEQAIGDWAPDLTPEQREVIAWGKQSRKDDLSQEPLDRVFAYSEAECVAAAKMLRKLITMVRDSAGVIINPRHVAGSGSIAGAALKFFNAPTRKESQTSEYDFLAILTYFGGKIEAPVIGKLPFPIYIEDINSCYPSKMIHLPCMRAGHGHWVHRKGRLSAARAATMTVGHVKTNWNLCGVYAGSTPPFVVRDADGLVYNPLTSGDHNIWVSMPEYAVGKREFSPYVEAVEYVYWVQDCDCPNPLAWLSPLYDKRSSIKAEMEVMEKARNTDSPLYATLDAKQKAIKLIINSVYGKLAQQRPHLGKYTNLHWASYITGAGRAQLSERAWRKEKAGGILAYMHTDSVKFFGTEVEDEGSALGKWGAEKPANGLFIDQPGFAIALAEGEEKKSSTRGVEKKTAIEAAREYANSTDFSIHPYDWPKLVVEGTAMVNRRQAQYRGKPWQAGSWTKRELEMVPSDTKRALFRAWQPQRGGADGLYELLGLEGNATFWIVPPKTKVDNPATIEDIKQYQTRLEKYIQAGHFDLGNDGR